MADFSPDEGSESLRAGIGELCRTFGDAYWREVDSRREYPDAFVTALTEGGWLAVLIPEQYGGSGLGITQAGLILEEINRNGGNSAAAHAQMYIMGTLLKHGSDAQKERYLPAIAAGSSRLQAFAVTEADAGSDTTRLRTTAVKQGSEYVINGAKVFISRAEHTDLMLLLARTTPYDSLEDKTEGLSIFLVDLKQAVAAGQLKVSPIRTMLNHHTTELTLVDLVVPEENLVGQEGRGFRHIIDSWNAERILIASEALGDGYWFTNRSTKYANERVVFGRPIGMNQGVQFPITLAHIHLEAARLMRDKAAWLFDADKNCGAEANMAKLLASQASWEAANAALDAHGGYGFAVEFDIERKFRETRLYSTAPVSNNMVLNFVAQRVLGLPRSY